MFGFLKRKSSKDRLEEVALELKKDRHYIIVVPDDIDPQDLLESGFFDDYNVFVVQADRLTVMEIG